MFAASFINIHQLVQKLLETTNTRADTDINWHADRFPN